MWENTGIKNVYYIIRGILILNNIISSSCVVRRNPRLNIDNLADIYYYESLIISAVGVFLRWWGVRPVERVVSREPTDSTI